MLLAGPDVTVWIRPTAQLPDDRYRIGFQVMVADNDPRAGVVEFEVSSTGVSQAPPWPSGDTAPEPAKPRCDIGNPLPLVVGAALVVVGLRFQTRIAVNDALTRRLTATTISTPTRDSRCCVGQRDVERLRHWAP